ncbi:unnamed protein product [Rotaria sordida]|uniref:AMP-binding enzyme C-terminal domain-containing protein n=2 Tax=Rotaria sordida TaxID=392033 RepID=A0A819U6J5_9BILA|nr:unnamed protein product [Rotaria sordida]
MDEDGYLYFVGRQKELIIHGGINIYPSVAEAQVFSIPDKRYGKEVCAWIKLKPNVKECQPEDITKFLADKLDFFKIPKHIRFIDKFIMTPTGKIQKFKLTEAMVNDLKQTASKQ